MIEVHVPLADGRELVLPRYTQPEPEHQSGTGETGLGVAGAIAAAHLLGTGSRGRERTRDEVKNVVETF